jgi:DNA repair exonuclease SbcCD ATPase subunit
VDDLAAAEINFLSPKHFKVGPMIMSAITTDEAFNFKGNGLERLTSVDSEDPRKNDESLRTMVQDWNQINVNFDALTTEVQNLTRSGSMFKTELMDTIKELQDSLVETDIKVQLIKTHISDPTDTRLAEPLQVWKALSLLREQTKKLEEELVQLKEHLEEQDTSSELKERVESVERALTELVPQLRTKFRTVMSAVSRLTQTVETRATKGGSLLHMDLSDDGDD